MSNLPNLKVGAVYYRRGPMTKQRQCRYDGQLPDGEYQVTYLDGKQEQATVHPSTLHVEPIAEVEPMKPQPAVKAEPKPRAKRKK